MSVSVVDPERSARTRPPLTRLKVQQQKNKDAFLQLPPDIDEKILARLDCVARSGYCATKGLPLEDSRHLEYTQICGEPAFRRLHNAKCAAERQRDDQELTELTSLILNNVQSKSPNDQRKLMDLRILLNDPVYKNLSAEEVNRICEEALNFGYLEAVKILLADERVEFNPSKNKNSALKKASDRGDADMITFLLEDERVDPSSNNNHALEKATGRGDTKIVKLLLADERVDPNAALNQASGKGFTEIVKLLLVDERVDERGVNAAIITAFYKDDTEIVQLLLADERVDEHGRNIVEATERGDTEMVKLLLADRELGRFRWFGNYALRQAAKNGFTEIVKLLLADEDDERFNATAFGVKKALIEAAKNGFKEIVKLLLADERVDHLGVDDALRQAAKNDDTEIVKLLLADKRVDDFGVNNALRQASGSGFTEIELLLASKKRSLSRFVSLRSSN